MKAVLLLITLAMATHAFAEDANRKSKKPALMPTDVRIERDVAYLAEGRKEKVDLYFPLDSPAGTRLPAVVWIHGGGWNGGQRDGSREVNICGTLARNGYVAMSIDYKLTYGKNAVWPANLGDCKTAVRWLRKNAERLGIDPDHIGVMGGSAGGHLASMLALTTAKDGFDPAEPYGGISCAVSCCVDMYGITDISKYHDVKMLGKTIAEAPELYRSASPLTYVRKDSVPFLILHGTADTTVNIEQSKWLDEALTKVGVEHDLVIIPNAPHTFDLQPAQRDLRPVVLAFLDKHLKGKRTTAASPPPADSAARPNIIMIMADDLGWGDVGFNGNTEIKTPNLDEMAKNSMRLTRFYTASPLCSPTRGSCLTGRHPWRFGVLAAHTGGLRIAEVTVAEVAHLAKYQTGFFGKWHLGWVKPEEQGTRGFYSPPWHHGFDETFATTSAVPTWNPTLTPEGENEPGTPWKGGKPYVHNGVEVADNMEGDDSRVIMDRVIPFVRGAAEKKQPFMACVWFHTPHAPVVAGPEYRKLYPQNGTGKQNYYGAITAMDEQIGRLRAELRSLGIADNTILFFTSDNGPSDPLAKKGIASAGPFRGHKHTMYEGGLRVPSLVESPGHVAAGTTSETMCGTVDYFPTVVELTGASLGKKAERPIDGQSMMPVLTGAAKERSSPLFFGYRRLYNDVDGQALVENRYKLLNSASPGGGYELYDLVADPGETTDLAQSKPDVLNTMKARMAEFDESCRRSRDGADYEF